MTAEFREFAYAVDTTLGVPATRVVPVHGTRAGEAPPAQRPRLGDALVAADVITPAQLAQCLRSQEKTVPRRRLGAVVVELGLASDVDVARGLAAILGFEFADPGAADVPLDVVRRLPQRTAELLGAVPIGAGETWLRVAVADPTDRYTVEALREATGILAISLAVATPRSIETALRRFWDPGYQPAAPALAATPEAEPEPPAVEEAPVPAAGGWEYAFVGDGLPSGHPGHTADLAGTERELARLGPLGWEAVGVSAAGVRMTVLLKRARP